MMNARGGVSWRLFIVVAEFKVIRETPGQGDRSLGHELNLGTSKHK
jgi:hypothetical protein